MKHYYTVRDLSDTFGIAEADVRTLARLGIVEAGRIGPSWVFGEDAFDALADLLDGDGDEDDVDGEVDDLDLDDSEEVHD